MKTIESVESFWDSNPCGLPRAYDPDDKKRLFAEIEKERYSKQVEIPLYAGFNTHKGQKVLEIGCGIGTDGIQFARGGASYTGIDLTSAGVDIARERFELFGQKGNIVKGNAEKLPFEDNYFDYVYSFGVIHHSTSPEKIVKEIYRVLKPGGTLTVMLYNKTSFYYLIEVKFIRRLFFEICDKRALCRAIFSVFNKRYAARFEAFREKLEKMKSLNRRPTWDEWVSMNTDDVFCPIARVYSRGQAKKLFSDFRNFTSEAWFIDKDNWFLWFVFVKFLPANMQSWLERRYGWFRMISAGK